MGLLEREMSSRRSWRHKPVTHFVPGTPPAVMTMERMRRPTMVTIWVGDDQRNLEKAVRDGFLTLIEANQNSSSPYTRVPPRLIRTTRT